MDPRREGVPDASCLARLRAHSPDAEQLILSRLADPVAREMAANDGRVMRLLVKPCPGVVLCQAVADALLRHRARSLRAGVSARWSA